MPNNKILFNREDLYKRVWEKSLVQVAADYGLSDNGLKKICNKMNVPIPYNGYWAKLKYGKEVFKTPLPNLKPGDLETYELEIKEKKEKEILERYQKLIEFENLPENKITVPERVTRLHPLVQQTKEMFSKARVGYRDDFIRMHRGICFNLIVTKNTYKRSIPILNTLLLELEKRGFKIQIPKDESEWVSSKILYDNFIYEIELRELSKYEMREVENSYTYKKELEKYKVGTGILKIEVKIDGGWEKITLVKDNNKIKLEEQMNQMFIRLYEIINNEILRKREIEEYWAKVREKEKEAERLLEERKKEQQRTDNLLKLAEEWNRVKYISTFLDEIEIAMKEKNLLSEEKKEWLGWARNKMKSINPINRVIL